MRRQPWWLLLAALVFVAGWKSASTLPVPDEELDTSTQLLGSSVVTSVSVVTGPPETRDVHTKTSTADRKRVIPARDLPASPADLMRPDKFQFFTLNKEGDVVKKQMTEKEIQSLIAAGGGHLPMEINEPQKVGDIPTGGMKVADVVQNVQNVLKSELNKPATVITSMPTIPGHANTEWSSILPAILGGESETAPVNEQDSPMPDIVREPQITSDAATIGTLDSTAHHAIPTKIPTKKPESSSTENYDITKRPIESLGMEIHTEKPMIQVPVITVDQKLPSHQPEEDTKPVFQMLNTMSAEKPAVQNVTHTDNKSEPTSSDHNDKPVKNDGLAKPVKVFPKPSVIPEPPVMVQATVIDEKVPEMIEIHYPSGNIEPLVVSHVRKPLNPESPIISSDSIPKLPEPEPPTTMTVVSETHSTSMKISGQNEIPLHKPIGSTDQQADAIQIFTDVKKPDEVTNKPTGTSNSQSKPDSTTQKSETFTEEPMEISTENSLLLQGISFFGNLPQAVSSIVTDLISDNSSSTAPIVENAHKPGPSKPLASADGSSGTNNFIKISEPTKLSAAQATTEKTISAQKPTIIEEPVYEKMPQIVPESPMHGTSPSEASSISHIIDTLNDPTSIISSAVGAGQFGIQKISQGELELPAANANQAAPLQTTNLPDVNTTSATLMNVESLAEPNSGKPMAPLPTELADSLTSMMFQISDARPSVLPLGENAGLDTTEKKNVANVNADEPSEIDNVSAVGAQTGSKLPENSENKHELPIQAEPETPVVVPEKVGDAIHEPSSTTNLDETKLTEPALKTNSTELPDMIPITTKTPSLGSTNATTTNDVDANSNETKEKPVDRITDQASEKFEATTTEKLQTGITKVNVIDDTVTDKTEAVAEEVATVESLIKVSTTEKTLLIEQSSTVTSPTSEANHAPTGPLASSTEHAEKINNVSYNSSATVQEFVKPEILKTEKPPKIQVNENDSELPIVHLDIMEAVPTKFHKVNESKLNESTDNNGESPLVRIKLTDPVTLVNNMIQSSNVVTQPTSVEPLTLPEAGSVPANTLASGLIAGYPSTTSSPTTAQETQSIANSTTVDPVKSLPEVSIPSNAPVVNVTENQATTGSKTSEIQSESSKRPPSQDLEKIDVTIQEKEIGTSTEKTATTPAPETSTKQSTIQEQPGTPDNSLLLSANATADAPIIKEELPVSITTTVSPTHVTEPLKTIPLAGSTAKPENHLETSTKLAEKVTTTHGPIVTTKSPLIDKAPENRIDITEPLTPPVSDGPGSDEKLPSLSKVNGISSDTSNKSAATTNQSASSETKIETLLVAPESHNSSNSEVHKDAAKVSTEKIIPSVSMASIETTTPRPSDSEYSPKLGTTESSQTGITTQNSIEASEIKSDTSSSSETKTATASALENTTTVASETKSKLEKEVEKIEEEKPLAEIAASEKLSDLPSTTSAPKQTEVRIQVNNTAVLVTKRPVPERPSQKLNDATKSPNNQRTEETTTPKVEPADHDSHGKLSEKHSVPVPVPVSAPGSNVKNEMNASSQHGASGVETETRIRLGDEETDKIKSEKTSETVENTRKPIKKTSDSDALPAVEKYVIVNSTDGRPLSETSSSASEVKNKIPALQKDESTSQLPTNIEITMNMPSNEKPHSAHQNEVTQVQKKPPGLHEKQPPSNKLSAQSSIAKPEKPVHKPIMNIKKDDTLAKPADEQWTLIPQQVHPAPGKSEASNPKRQSTTEVPVTMIAQEYEKVASTERPPVSLDHPQSASGLDRTVQNLEPDVSYFVNLCNELAFSFWTATNKGLSTARSLAVSPFGMTSMLAMVFLGARGPTSDQMNDVLKLDDVASFNPHLVFQNVTDAVSLARNQGIANAAFVRELFADRSKVRKLMPFYKEQAQQFYDGIVAEVNFATISDLVRRRTNLMIRKQTGGRIKDFVRTNTVPLRSPLAALSANVFQTDCNSSAASSEGRDGELYFAVSPAVRQRKLVPVPATVWRAGVLAGYEPGLDATAIALGGTDKLVSTIFVIPGQQGLTAPGDTLDRLEQRLVRGVAHDGSWKKLLKVLIPRPGLELQVPKFSHRSVINATAALKRMGLEELFSKHADLKGINGVATDLHLADVLQMNLFSTCGDENIISGRHHVEVYPGSPLRGAREYDTSEKEFDQSDESESQAGDSDGSRGLKFPYVLHRQNHAARQNDSAEKQRLKLDRPFLYFVRHNPTGLILHMGRFNPRLLP